MSLSAAKIRSTVFKGNTQPPAAGSGRDCKKCADFAWSIPGKIWTKRMPGPHSKITAISLWFCSRPSFAALRPNHNGGIFLHSTCRCALILMRFAQAFYEQKKNLLLCPFAWSICWIFGEHQRWPTEVYLTRFCTENYTVKPKDLF